MRKFFLLFILITNVAYGQAIKSNMTKEQIKAEQVKILKKLGRKPEFFAPWSSQSEYDVSLQSVTVSPSQNRIHLYCSEFLGRISIRQDIITRWENSARSVLGAGYENVKIQFYAKNIPVERLIPNLYRKTADASRQGKRANQVPLTENLERPVFGKGMSFRHIALWASHGYYYDKVKKQWMFQRPPLFGSIEDLNTFEYAYRYLIPMLENAGAVVISPRERDPNPEEYIFDIDKIKVLKGNWQRRNEGWGYVEVLKDENPFNQGKYLFSESGGEVEYLIDVPRGEYALYVSYKRNPRAATATYNVRHSGGQTEYRVNQRMGSGWIYLGKHIFDEKSCVRLSGEGVITADAIRIGGGRGNVSRGGAVSGLPRWAEGARYSLQYNGVPADVYAVDSQEKPDADYYDDYKSRGDWVNWLRTSGDVPVDVAVALHTNAGINDSIYGTLTICYTDNQKGKFENGVSRLAARDMADVILNQIVSDIQAKYTKQWTHRSIYDKKYAEVARPQVPAVIVELLSHQNMNDVLLALNPSFRFDAARAIYKGILRFLSSYYNVSYVVQPLPPTAFAMDVEDDKLFLKWKPVKDELEPTARSDYYKVYERVGDGGFGNGVIVRDTKLALPILRDGKMRSYYITALNEGGESFPTEILSSCFVPNSKDLVMLIDESNVLSAPDTVAGGLNFDKFMPYKHDLGIVGKQVNFNRSSKFIDNENPGWGASTMELATIGIKGNAMDNTLLDGAALVAEGFSYISASKDGYVQLFKGYKNLKICSLPER